MNNNESYSRTLNPEEEKNSLKIAMEAVLQPARDAGKLLEDFAKKNIL